MYDNLIAAFLGFIEGLTEFIPVSSTGHLIVLVDAFHLKTPEGRVFEVFIQLGAILAVMLLYHRKIWQTIIGLPREKTAQKFTLNLIAATIPALILGAMLHGWVKEHLYNPLVIALALIIGGIVILFLERKTHEERIQSVDDIPIKTAFLVGCCQAVALIPGVSRSGATIMGALGLGLARPVAAEFSFFLAMPVMTAAVLFDVLKNWDTLKTGADWDILLIGFTTAFLTALAVVRFAMFIISRYGFAPFAWYRIVAGFVILALFYL